MIKVSKKWHNTCNLVKYITRNTKSYIKHKMNEWREYYLYNWYIDESNNYRLLKTSEVDGNWAFILSRTKCSHCDIGDSWMHHECGEVMEKHSHEEMAQTIQIQFLHNYILCVCLAWKATTLNIYITPSIQYSLSF